jgi:hypothetical protein
MLWFERKLYATFCIRQVVCKFDVDSILSLAARQQHAIRATIYEP